MSAVRRRGQPQPVGEAKGVPTEIVLQQENLHVGTTVEETGRVRAHKRVETETVAQTVERGVEHADIERGAVADPEDNGDIITLPDGSVSIPVFEEQIVVTKQLVVRERIIIRKHTVYEQHSVSADLRREHLEINTEGDVALSADG